MGECGTCERRPVRYVASQECATCYNRRYRAEHRDRHRAYMRGWNRKSRAKTAVSDRTSEMPEFDLAKDITYQTAHQRVSRWRGAATMHPCSDCGNSAREWAYLGSSPHEMAGVVQGPFGAAERELPYSPDPLDYTPLCRGCHVRRDLWMA